MEFNGILSKLISLFDEFLNTCNCVKKDFKSFKEIDILITKLEKEKLATLNKYRLLELNEDIKTLLKWKQELKRSENAIK